MSIPTVCSKRWKVLPLLLACSVTIPAAIRPSLNIESSTWNSTDIVVVAATLNKATFQVTETIKGDTQPGDVLLFDGLAPPDSAVTDSFQALAAYGKVRETPPASRNQVRMIVFLQHAGEKPEFNARPDLPVNTEGWQPASAFGDLRTSAVWLQNGGAFGFLQTGNPGPAHFISLELSEKEIRQKVSD